MHVFDWRATEDRIRVAVAEEKSTAKNLATALALCGLLRDSHDGSVAGEARVISVTKEDTMMSAPYSLAAGGLGVGLISVPRVPVETRCFSRAPRMPSSQVIDCDLVPVAGKRLEFPEKNISQLSGFREEIARDFAGIRAISERTGNFVKSAGCDRCAL